MEITIAVPSFNRPCSALVIAQDYLQRDLKSDLKLLIVNNGSTESYTEIENLSKLNAQFQYIKFDMNNGFAESLIRLIECSEGDYMFLLSDEDDFEYKSLASVIEVLRTRKPPMLLCRKYKFQLWKRNCSKLKLRNVWSSCAYMSGVIINIELAKSLLSFIRNCAIENEFVKLYPHVAIAYVLAQFGDNIKLNISAHISRENLPSSILSTSGNQYYLTTERIRQHVSLIELLDDIAESFPKTSKKMNQLKDEMDSKLLHLLLESVENTDPRLKMKILSSMPRTYLYYLLKSCYRKLFRNKSSKC